MKLIVGERLMNLETKNRLLREIQRVDEQLTYDEMVGVLAKAGLTFVDKKCLQCCFIFLLKMTDCLLRVRSSDFKDFIH